MQRYITSSPIKKEKKKKERKLQNCTRKSKFKIKNVKLNSRMDRGNRWMYWITLIHLISHDKTDGKRLKEEKL